MAKRYEGASKVVVGVDGSNHSRAALEWAAAEAVRRGAELRIVHALGMPLVVSAHDPTRFRPTDEINQQAPNVLQSRVHRARELPPSGTGGTGTAMGEAALGLLRQKRRHELNVIGNRG